MLCLPGLLWVATDVDTQHLSSVPEKEAREYVAVELQARAQSLVLDAADAAALSPALGQPTLEERLASFLARNAILSRLSMQGRDGLTFERRRPGPIPSDEFHRVRDLDAQVRVQIAQPTPRVDAQLMGRLFRAPLAPSEFLRLLKRQADGMFRFGLLVRP